MTITRVTFTKPLGNIRVDFPMEARPSYEVSFGVVALTTLQAEEAAQYGWAPVEDPRSDLADGLVEVKRSMVAYGALKVKHQC